MYKKNYLVYYNKVNIKLMIRTWKSNKNLKKIDNKKMSIKNHKE